MRAMCGVQLKFGNRSMDLMFMLSLSETIDQLAMASSVRWHGHVLRREDGHVMVRAIYFEIEDQRKKGRWKRTWKKQVKKESMNVGLRKKESMNVGLRKKDALC